MAKRGIDIASHQGNIDLAALKAEIDFVIIRVGYGVSGTIDTKFKRNADLCLQLGIPFGFYWYSYALNEAGAEAEANAFLNAIAPYKDSYSYGCWFDMEDADHYKQRKGMPSNQTLRNMCAKFCSKVQEAGYYAGIYASSSWFSNQLNGPEINPFDKWVAQWPTSGGKQRGLSIQASERSDKTMWQFTSEGHFANYSGRLDTNYAYLDYPSIIRGNTPAPQPQPEATTKKSNEEIAQEVSNGLWGNGEERKQRLRAAGYDPSAIQAIVNKNAGAATNVATYSVYTVVSGDTLSKIGSKYGVNWKDIASLNGIAGPKYIIYPGQKLKIKTGTGSVAQVQTPTPQATHRTYTVVSGDTLSGIGAKTGVNWRTIADLNGIRSPYVIYPKQVLKLN